VRSFAVLVYEVPVSQTDPGSSGGDRGNSPVPDQIASPPISLKRSKFGPDSFTLMLIERE
jgi:hypothetical protein